MGPSGVLADDLHDLLCRASAGDAGAVDELARVLRPELVRAARSRLRDHALVDDVVQEALLEVLATVDRLRDPRALRGWLRLVVRKHVDRATRGVRTTSPLDDERDALDPGDSPELVAERRGDVATIRRALRVVGDADALLLRLRYLGEWSDAELADLVGAAPGTIRKRLHDARRRLRSVVVTIPPPPAEPTHDPELLDMNQRHDLPALLGRTVAPTDVPSTGAARLLPPSGERLETEIKVLDAVLPIERGGTVDLLGPVGMGQLVLVAEIARHVGAVVVAAGTDLFGGLVEEDVLGRSAVVVDGGDPAGAAAADRLAQALAASGRTVLLVVGAAAWTEHPPTAGVVDGGVGSVTAFRFAPHPRDGAPIPAREDAGTRLVWATDAFVAGHHPAIDVPSSASALIDRKLLDPVTVGAAQAARVALERAGRVAAFLTQPMILGEAFTGVPGEQVPARSATEQLAALVR